MAERKISWKLKGSLLVGSVGLVVAGGTYLVVDAQGGGGHDRLPPAVGNVLDLTPTPTATPLVFESPLVSLASTETPLPIFTATPAETVPPSDKGAPVFVEPPTVIPRPVWTQPPVIVPTLAPTSEPTIAPTPEVMPMNEWADQLFNLINQFRAENGIGPLNRNAVLDQSTQRYAEFLISNNLIFSENIHNLKGMPIDRANAITPVWFYVGEVEAHYSVYGGSPQVMLDMWKNSPGHRRALLSFPDPEPDARITELGVGCAVGDYLFPDNTRSPYVVCNGALGILDPPPTP